MENSHIPSESEKGKIILRGNLPVIQISQLFGCSRVDWTLAIVLLIEFECPFFKPWKSTIPLFFGSK